MSFVRLIISKMIKLLFLLSCLTVILGLDPTVGNALKSSVLNSLKDAIFPLILKEIPPKMKLDSIGGNIVLMEYEVSDISLRIGDIKASQISISFNGDGSIRATGRDFGVDGSAEIYGRMGLIWTTADAGIKVRKIGFDTSIAIKSNGQRPNIDIREFKLIASPSNVEIWTFGSFIVKVLELIAQLLKSHIINGLVSGVQKEVPPTVNKIINDKLNKLPLSFNITDNINLTYRFPLTSTVNNGYLVTKILAYAHPKTDPSPPPAPIGKLPEYNSVIQRDLQFFISDYVIRSALYSAYRLKTLTLKLGMKIKHRQVFLDCAADDVPEFIFKYAIEARGTATCKVLLDKDPNPKFQLMTKVDLRLKETVKNAILFFYGEKLEFTKLDFKIIQPFDITWFKEAINDVIAAMLEALNGEFGMRGIPLPTIEEVDYEDIVQNVEEGYTVIGTTPKFHFSTKGTEKNTDLLFDHSSDTVRNNDDVIAE